LDSGQKTALLLGAAHYLKKPSIGQPMQPFFEKMVSTVLVSQG